MKAVICINKDFVGFEHLLNRWRGRFFTLPLFLIVLVYVSITYLAPVRCRKSCFLVGRVGCVIVVATPSALTQVMNYIQMLEGCEDRGLDTVSSYPCAPTRRTSRFMHDYSGRFPEDRSIICHGHVYGAPVTFSSLENCCNRLKKEKRRQL